MTEEKDWFTRNVVDWVQEGHKHGIPTCCGIRFGLSQVIRLRYRIDSRLQGTPFHGLASRVQDLTPRHAYAHCFNEGYIPCEYHLAKWLLTNQRPEIRQD